MAASPLAAALLGGNDNNAAMLGVDPDLMAANSDAQLGAAMQRGGMDTSPAYLGTALGRLGQALAGTYVKRSALSDLGKAYASSASKLSQAFDPKDPVQKFLNSDDPFTRGVGIQAAKQALILKSEPYSLEPQQQRQINGAVVGSGSPELAGQVAAERAPYEAGGEGMVTGSDGVAREIPLTAMTRRLMQPAVQPAAQPNVQPSVQAPSRPSGLSVPPSPTAAIPPPQPKTQSPPAATGPIKDQDRIAPQGAIPGTGVSGKPLPNPAVEPAVKADTEELAKDRETAMKGQQDMATIRAVQDFAPKVKTGWSADTKLEGARILKGIGVPDAKIKDFMNTDVAAGQILQKKFVELSAAAARTMGAREPGSVIQMFAKAYPNLGTDPAAIKLQTNALYMDRLRSQHLADEKTNYLNDSINGVQSTGQYRGLKGFNEAFNKSHPAESYLHAAEAMSGASEPWSRVTGTGQRNAIIRLIPPASPYMGPDAKMHVTPGSAQ